MPTPAQIRSELQADPAGLGYAAPLAERRDNDLHRLMGERRFRGWVPIVELSAYCVEQGITGGILALDALPVADLPGADLPARLAVKGLLSTVRTLIQDDYRLELADTDLPAFGAALDGLIGLGVMTAGQKAALMAMGANRRSRLDVLGWAIGVDAISAALNEGQ